MNDTLKELTNQNVQRKVELDCSKYSKGTVTMIFESNRGTMKGTYMCYCNHNHLLHKARVSCSVDRERMMKLLTFISFQWDN